MRFEFPLVTSEVYEFVGLVMMIFLWTINPAGNLAEIGLLAFMAN